MEDDITRQVDEIECLSSIYDKQWRKEDKAGRSYSINITDTVILYVSMPYNYPSQAPPTYQISAPDLSHDEKKRISRILEETYLENIGEAVIFQWIEAVRTYFNNKTDLVKDIMSDRIEEMSNYNCKKFKNKKECMKEPDNQPKITHGEIIVDRKSTFQGHAAAVSSFADVKRVLAVLLENKKIANAKHNIFAYRILKDKKCLLQDCDDDGESQAGRRLLQLLQIMDLTGVVVVVTRWYGGIHLGPDRFRHINNAARQVLVSAGFAKSK